MRVVIIIHEVFLHVKISLEVKKIGRKDAKRIYFHIYNRHCPADKLHEVVHINHKISEL